MVLLSFSAVFLIVPVASDATSPPFERAEFNFSVIKDVTGDGSTFVDGSADATTGVIRAEAKATSASVLPTGAILFEGNMGLGSNWAKSWGQVIQTFPSLPSGNVTVSASFGEIVTTRSFTGVDRLALFGLSMRNTASLRATLHVYHYPDARTPPTVYTASLPSPPSAVVLSVSLDASSGGFVRAFGALVADAQASGGGTQSHSTIVGKVQSIDLY